MIFKSREKPLELTFYELLDQRMSFSKEEQRNYLKLQKGYEGEILFDQLSQSCISHFAVLNDLLLETNNTLFQIDSLIVTGEAAHLFEVKNSDGEYFYEQGRLYSISGKERGNPLIQLKRSESLLHQLFQYLHFPLPVESHVIFINPNFTLFQAPKRTQFVLPTQFHSFIRTFSGYSPFNSTHQSFVNKLISMHQTANPYSRIPNYQYDRLKKGIKCHHCKSLSMRIKERSLLCKKCGVLDTFKSGVVRSVHEIKCLFPKKKITTNLVMEWCDLNIDKRRVRRILEANFIKQGVRQWTYYE